MKQEKDYEQIIDQINKQELTSVQQQIESQFLDKYFELLGNTPILKISDQKLEYFYGEQLLKYGILYSHKHSHSEFSLTIKEQSINSQVVVFEVKWGKFKSIITALNINSDSSIHQTNFVRGGYGKVYFNQIEGKQFAVKCIRLNIFHFNHTAKVMAVKQIFLMKIAAALKIGPQVKNIFGFDLIIHKECIQFAMEKCKQLTNLIGQKKVKLKASLSLLHCFKIIHFDLKPSNIMFSPSFNCEVFIDFGLSQIISEQIGRKSYLFFRGTLDFASTQMVEAFQSKQKKHIDVYYNDAHSLQAIFKYLQFSQDVDDLMQNSKMNCQHQINEYSEETHWKIIGILMTKYWIFTGNIQCLKLFFKNNKEEIDGNLIEQLLDFLSQVDPNEQLKQFYDSCLNSYHKQSIKYSYLQKIYRFNNYFRKMKINQSKKYRNYELNRQFITNDDNQPFFNKITIQQLLYSQQINPKIDTSVYFKIFIEYISFSNNKYRISTIQRTQVSQILLKKYYNDIDMEQYSNTKINFIKCTIKCMFMNYVFGNKFNFNHELDSTNDPEKLKVIKQNIFDLLQHLFILKIAKCDEIINWLQNLYQKTYFSNYDKLELILRVKQNNYWYLFSANSKTNDCKRDLFYNQVKFWCVQKIKIIKQDTSIKWMANLILQNITISHMQINLQKTQQQKLNLIPFALRQLFYFQISYKQVCNAKSQISYKYINFIYRQISNEDRDKLHFFMFFIFIFYLQESRNLQKCRQIIYIFQKNLADQQLIKDMFFQYFIMCTSTKILFTLFSKYIESVNLFLQKINLSVLIIHCDIIKKVIYYFYQFMNDFKYSNSSQINNNFELIRANILVVWEWINFQNITFFKLQNPQDFHKCFEYPLIQALINIKKYISLNQFIQYDVFDDYCLLQKSAGFKKCEKCIFTVKCIQLIQQLKQIVVDCGDKKILDLNTMIQAYEHISTLLKNHQKNDEIQNFIKMINYQFMYFCVQDQKYQQQYGGIRKLYFYFKNLNQLQNYLYYQSIHYQILKATIFAIFQYQSLRQLVYFLNFSSNHLTNYFSEGYFEIIFVSFSQFVDVNYNKIDFIAMMQILEQMQKQQKITGQKVNRFNIVYYYILMFYLTGSYFQKCITKIVNQLDFLSLRIKIFFEAHMYRIIYRQNIKEIQSKTTRKNQLLKIKIIKLFKMYGKVIMKLKVRFNSNSIKIRKMQKKALLLGGPFQMDTNIPPLFATVHQKANQNY